jgi:hypothetical protein
MTFSVGEVAAVAKQQTPEDDGGKKGKEPQTSTRLYAADNDDLTELGAMLKLSAADVFARLCRPVVRTALRAELKRKAAELDRDQK